METTMMTKSTITNKPVEYQTLQWPENLVAGRLFEAALAFRRAVAEANRCWGGAQTDRDTRNAAWIACRRAYMSIVNNSAAAAAAEVAALRILVK